MAFNADYGILFHYSDNISLPLSKKSFIDFYSNHHNSNTLFAKVNFMQSDELEEEDPTFWDNVADYLNCVDDSMADLHWTMKAICYGGCGGCVLTGGAAVFACAACVGCLAGAGISCTYF